MFSRMVFFLICIFLFAFTTPFAQDEIYCGGQSSQQQTQQIGGAYVSANGTIKALFIFIDFKDDTFEPNSITWPVGTGPNFLNNIVDSTDAQNSGLYANVTTFFDSMGFGQFQMIGKAYYVQAPESLAYYKRVYPGNEVAYSSRDVIQILDQTVDFSDFDRWTSNYYSHSPGSDGKVDMVFFCYRIWYRYRESSSNSFFAEGWWSASLPGDVYVDGGVRRIGGAQTVDVLNMIQYPRIEHLLHEFGHVWGLPHQYGAGTWALMGQRTPSTSSFMNLFEREQLGWVNYNTITTTTTFTLPDFGSTGTAYRVQIPGTSEYYLLENHQKLTLYDVPDKTSGGQGLYILHNVFGIASPNQGNIKVINADGRWNWDNPEWIQNPWSTDPNFIIPVFRRLTINRTSGKTERNLLYAVNPKNDSGGYYYINAWKNYQTGQTVTGEIYKGDGKDSWNLTNNNVFSPYSNPAATKANGTTVPVVVEVQGQSGSVLTIKVYINDTLSSSPSKPQGVTATYNASNQAVVTWLANLESDVTSGGGYNIYREIYYGSTIVSSIKLNSSLVTSTSYTDQTGYSISGVTSGIDLYCRYKVEAVDNTAKVSVKSDGAEIFLGKTVSGTIASSTVWNENKIFVGNVTVNNGATLTIASGVAVHDVSNITVSSGAALVINSGAMLKFNSATNVYDESSPKGSLLIYGKIQANGATFTSNSSNPNYYWAAIYIVNSNQSGNYFRTCHFSNCKFAMVLNNSYFFSSGNEIYNNTFTNCLNPIRLIYGTYVANINSNTFYDNLEDGIVIFSSYAGTINGNTFEKQSRNNSGRDLFWIYNSSDMVLTNNTIAFASQDGIRCETYSSPVIGTSATANGNKIILNNRHGVHAQSTTTPFLGGYLQAVCNDYGGNNSIYSNSGLQLFVATSSQFVSAEHNWWGTNPNSGNGFTTATMNVLFGNTYPDVDPALWQSDPHPLIVHNPIETEKSEMSFAVQDNLLLKQVSLSTESITDNPIVMLNTTVSRERILLTLGNQLAMSQLYDKAIAVYDTLVTFYPSSDEAEAALLQINTVFRRHNSAAKNRAIGVSPKSSFQYFQKIADEKTGTRLERVAVELAALNASAEGNSSQAIVYHKKILNGWQNSESERRSLAALTELYWTLDDKAEANKYIAELQSKYADDPVTALLLDTKYMMDNIVPVLAKNGGLNNSQIGVEQEESNKANENVAAVIPTVTALHQNYPNPFNPVTTIRYDLSQAGMVDIAVFDILGRQITQLVHGYEAEGIKSVQFNGNNVPSGIYFIRLKTQDNVFTRRMLLMK